MIIFSNFVDDIFEKSLDAIDLKYGCDFIRLINDTAISAGRTILLILLISNSLIIQELRS